MLHIDVEALELAQILWDFHRFETPIERCDFAIALGCHDEEVAVAAADSVLNQTSPILVCSGGHGKVTRDLWSETEAERFARVATARGVPREAIILEPAAMNTAQNVTLSRSVLEARGIETATGLLVAKPYMRRRAHATAEAQWPEVAWSVTSEDVSMTEYLARQNGPDLTIDLMVGDLQRVVRYAELGFQVQHDVPGPVHDAYLQLVALGFSSGLLT